MTVQRRTSSPHPSPAYSDEVASESARDDYPTEVFQPFRDDEPDEHGEYVDPGHWQPSATDEPESAEPPTQSDPAQVDEVHADQATARIDPEYPTQVIEAYRDEPEHDGTGYQSDGEYADAGHDGASYDSTGYATTGYENAAGHDGAGYDNAGYDNAGHDGASYDGNGYAEPAHQEQGYSDAQQGYSDAQQGYQEAPEAGYATEVAHDGSGYAEAGYTEAGYTDHGHEDASHDGGSYDAEGYPEQGHPAQAYADQGYSEQGYSDQGYDGASYEQSGDEHGGYQEAGYADDGYEDGGPGQGGQPDAGYPDDGYADADYAQPGDEQATPARPADEPVPVAEQLFGSYHPGSDEYVDTAIIPRITDHGTIIEDGDGELPAADGDAVQDSGHGTNGQVPQGHDSYGHDGYGHDGYGHEEYGQGTNGQGTNGQLATDHADYPTAEQSAAELAAELAADEPTEQARGVASDQRHDSDQLGTEPGQTRAGQTRADQTRADQTRADQNSTDQDREHGAEGLAEGAAAGLMTAHGSVADNPHAVGPELLAGYSGDEGARAGRPAELDDDGEGRTELIPRYTDDRAKAAKQPRPAVLAMVLLVVAVLAAGAGFFSAAKAQQADQARPTGNIAFLDRPATAEVKDQVSKAIEAIYSYDSAQLDQSENRALSFITGSYTDEFKANFATVRQLGPQEKASLISTVVGAGVESLTQSRATLLVMVNQVGHRGDNPQPLRAAVRLNVTAQKVDGQWKVSGVNQK